MKTTIQKKFTLNSGFQLRPNANADFPYITGSSKIINLQFCVKKYKKLFCELI